MISAPLDPLPVLQFGSPNSDDEGALTSRMGPRAALPVASHLPVLFPVQGAKGQEGAQGPPGAAGNPVSPPGSHRRGSGPSTCPRPGSPLWAECGEGAGKAPSTLEGWPGPEPPEQPGPETCRPLPRSQHLRASPTCQPRKESPAHTWVAHTWTHADEFVPLRSTPTCTSTRLETEMHTHRDAHTHNVHPYKDVHTYKCSSGNSRKTSTRVPSRARCSWPTSLRPRISVGRHSCP